VPATDYAPAPDLSNGMGNAAMQDQLRSQGGSAPPPQDGAGAPTGRVIDNGVIVRAVPLLDESARRVAPDLPVGLYVEVIARRQTGPGPNDVQLQVRDTAQRELPGWIPGNAFHAEPQLPEAERGGSGNLGYDASPQRGFLWGERGPVTDDVHQGSLGTCWAEAAMTSVVARSPQHITSRFGQTEPLLDAYDVTLFTDQGGGRFTPITRRIDSRMPTNRDFGAAIGTRTDSGSSTVMGWHPPILWPALLEKALAFEFGGYDDIDRGSFGDRAIAAITGQQARTDIVAPDGRITTPGGTAPAATMPITDVLIRSVPESDALARLSAHTAPLCFSSSSTCDDHTLLSAPLRIYGRHEYSFVDVANGLVRLHNPWGREHPEPLTIEQLRTHFVSVSTTVSGLGPARHDTGPVRGAR
jgi:hypothetical protein